MSNVGNANLPCLRMGKKVLVKISLDVDDEVKRDERG